MLFSRQEIVDMGLRIKQARKARKWSREDLETLAGVGQNVVYYVETGRCPKNGPSVMTIARIGSALGKSLDYLIRGVER